MKDIGLTEQAKFYENFKDPSPLTDETLEELGFYIKDDNYAYSINGVWLIGYKSEKGRKVKMKDHSFPTYKTVGSVKMLIEALKGE
jgi:hypothetical protein